MTKPLNSVVDGAIWYRHKKRVGTNSSATLLESGRPHTNSFSFERVSVKKSHALGMSQNPQYLAEPEKYWVRNSPFPRGDQYGWDGGVYTGIQPPHPDLAFLLRGELVDTDVSALTTAMEGKETIKGLGDRAKRLGDAYRALRHGDIKSFGSALDVSVKKHLRKPSDVIRKNASGHLLEYQFGIVPIYADMLGSATTLFDLSRRTPILQFKTSIKSRETETGGTVSYSHRFRHVGGPFIISSTIPVPFEEKVTVIHKAYAYVEIQRPALEQLDAFGLTNPIASLWAIAPQSWIADAFLPIGSFLNQLYLPPSMKIIDCGRVVIQERLQIEAPVNYANKNSHGIPGLTFKLEGGFTKVSRIGISPFNIDGPRIPRTQMSLPFLGQAITMTAYGDQQSKKLTSLIKKFKRS